MAPGGAAGPARDDPSLAPPGVQTPRVAPIKAGPPSPADVWRDDRVDRAYGAPQPTLGRRANPRRTAQTRHPRRQAHDPEVRAAHSWTPTAGARAILGDLPSPSRP